jgi:hypothetical protein
VILKNAWHVSSQSLHHYQRKVSAGKTSERVYIPVFSFE